MSRDLRIDGRLRNRAKRYTYWTWTISEETGLVSRIPHSPIGDDSAITKRLGDPTPFAPNEWSEQVVGLFREDSLEDLDDWTQCDVFSIDLYPVISPRFKALLETTLGRHEVEFLPIQLVGKATQQPLGTYAPAVHWAENELKKHGQSACEGVKKAAYEHAQRLLRAVGITDFDWEECLRYNAKSLLKSLRDKNRKWD